MGTLIGLLAVLFVIGLVMAWLTPIVLVLAQVISIILRSFRLLSPRAWREAGKTPQTAPYRPPGRPPIPSDVKRAVFARDQGRCVLCGSNENLHYDHDLPYSRGGGGTVENMRLLCASCNLRKGSRIE